MFRQFKNAAQSSLLNLAKTLRIAWQTDKKLVFGYFFSASLVALVPLLLSFTTRYIIDELVIQQANQVNTIPLVILVLLGTHYVIHLIAIISQWGLYFGYFDYLLRYRLQNQLNILFAAKLSSLDVQHLEDPEVQNLISKSKETFMWRMPDLLRVFSYIFGDLVALISAILVLTPFGWWIPLLIIAASFPRFLLRSRQGNIQWSIYGSGAPEVRKLWYFGWLLTTNSAIREMKIFQSQSALLNKFKRTQEHIYNLNKKPIDSFLKIMLVLPILEVAALCLVIYILLPDALAGILTIGSFTFLITMVDRLSGSAAGVGGNMGEFYENSLYADHFFQVMALPELIKEDDHPISIDKSKPPKIEFKNVSFAYPNGHLILKDVSFVIEPGESVALVGVNGAGKSTLIKLLCRFYDVTDGEILINGVNLKQLKKSDWYSFMGTLFQDFVQYHFTVRENIMLGDSDKNDEKAVEEAARKSGAAEFIDRLPNKYDQILGREFADGEELSGGQWQKLAIARAFYQSAPILIMDEPTSAIDAESEYEIFNNLEKEYKNKTLILVSHRFSTVRNANKIVVIDDGKIIETGSHDKLMKNNSKYATMFKIQAKGYQ